MNMSEEHPECNATVLKLSQQPARSSMCTAAGYKFTVQRQVTTDSAVMLVAENEIREILP
jgi:hypothetical protein